MIPALTYTGKTILVCPLDWGLGHASRCVPLIRKLMEQKNRVIVGCTSDQRKFFEGEVKDVVYTDLFGYNVAYSKTFPVAFKLMLQYPRLRRVVRAEHEWLKRFLRENKIDLVISDNRYGLYSNNCESVIITHQLNIPAPLLNKRVNILNQRLINVFSECWVPDFEDVDISLAGNLSHPAEGFKRVKYIGPLSRFERAEPSGISHDVLVLLSGLEPQRSLLEKKLTHILGRLPLNVTLVQGTTAPANNRFPDNFTVYSLAQSEKIRDLIISSRNIICRSGYSTLMDLHALREKAILIPTPGQAEQEYLANYWNEKFAFPAVKQKDIDETSLLEELSAGENHSPRKQFSQKA